MRPFDYSFPTQVIARDEATERVGDFARLYGSTCMLVTGNLAAHRSGARATVVESLEAARMTVVELEGVPSNPSTAVVDAGARLARGQHVDCLVALGGGSVIDTAKAIATTAVSERSYRDYLSGIRADDIVIDRTLPVIAIPTLFGSGSETNGTSVIIDDVTGRKLSHHSELAAPRVAVLDPRWVASAPAWLRAAGAADAMCHAIEAAMCERASAASDACSRMAIEMLLEHGVHVARDRVDVVEDGEALAAVLWASNLAGVALSIAGSLPTHPLAHGLSARVGTHHGIAVAAIEPQVIATLGDRVPDRIDRVARWLGARPSSTTAAVNATVKRLRAWFGDLGLTDELAAVSWEQPVAGAIIADALASGSRGLEALPGPAMDEATLARVLGLPHM
jgi:alcohol dehydrogenase class IV